MKSHLITITLSAAIIVGGGSAIANADTRVLDHRHVVLPTVACATPYHNDAASVNCYWESSRWEPGMPEDARHSSWAKITRDGRGTVLKVRFLDADYNRTHKIDEIVGS